MIHDAWIDGVLARMWQVSLHAAICGVVFFFWTRRLDLPSGRTRRRLLAATLILPPLTALVPGRLDLGFRSSLAWFDSARILAVPLGFGARVHHLLLAAGLLAIVATLLQELLPIIVRRRARCAAPRAMRERARALPGWGRCEVALIESDTVEIATDGWPWRPRALFSSAAVERLDADALDAALLHEHAHWRAGRWWVAHALFVVRLIQCFNPIALWCFREYCLEVEIACDAAAVERRDPRPLGRALLEVYETSDRRDRSRHGLRKRVELLLGDRPRAGAALPFATECVALAALALVLPWIV